MENAASNVEIEAPELPSNSNSAEWKSTIDRVVQSVVVLKVTLTRSVDTEAAHSGYVSASVHPMVFLGHVGLLGRV